FTTGKVLDTDMIISRTGYTGEDGFELYMPSPSGEKVWDALLETGKSFGIQPCGLGARDTLRIEMRYPLYGHELSKEITPLEADLEWVVKWKKGDFIGKEALTEQKEKGISRHLKGFELLEDGIPRQGYLIYSAQNELIGEVTSGTLSPFIKKGIGIGFIKPPWSSIGEEINIEIRSKRVKAKIVETPFVKRRKKS
ncbi:MAG: glycine cleavage T C-terminal barrel domain-containing protein, partial [Deltaproteobacteria bacterium]